MEEDWLFPTIYQLAFRIHWRVCGQAFETASILAEKRARDLSVCADGILSKREAVIANSLLGLLQSDVFFAGPFLGGQTRGLEMWTFAWRCLVGTGGCV